MGAPAGSFTASNEDDLRKFLAHPNTMFASDSGVRRYQEGVAALRAATATMRGFLATYVRELKLLRLEEAIRRMTSLPASTFRLDHRGELREGNWADLVVLDPAKVAGPCHLQRSSSLRDWLSYVFVNGVAVVKDDQHTGARPGKALRHGER